MSVIFRKDIDIKELNLPPGHSYETAEKYSNLIKTGNFIKKHWGKLKNQIGPEEIDLNLKLRKLFFKSDSSAMPIEVDYDQVKPKENIYWFRPSQCFFNVIIPLYMLNDKQSNPNDRYQMVVNDYHAAIFDKEENVLYDPTMDILYTLGLDIELPEKKIATLGMLISKEAIFPNSHGLSVGTLSLSEYLNKTKQKSNNRPIGELFNEILGREVIHPDLIGDDLTMFKY